MWIGNVRNLPFEHQLRTTAAGGLDELSMTPLDFDRNIAPGLSARDMRKMAEDKLPQGTRLATLTLGIEATLRNVW
jgi:hypothetical protein